MEKVKWRIGQKKKRWSEDSIQAMLEGSKRNKDVYRKISQEMEAAGFSNTSEQCNSKMKKLCYEYKKIKDNHGKTGKGRKDWKYYNAMDDVLGHRPATQPSITVESSLSDIASGTSSNTDTIDELENGEETVLENGDDICSVFDDEMSRNRSVTPGSNTERCRNMRRNQRGRDQKVVMQLIKWKVYWRKW